MFEERVASGEHHWQGRDPPAPHLGPGQRRHSGGVARHVGDGVNHGGGRALVEPVQRVQGLGAQGELGVGVQADGHQPGSLPAHLVERHQHLGVFEGRLRGVRRHQGHYHRRGPEVAGQLALPVVARPEHRSVEEDLQARGYQPVVERRSPGVVGRCVCHERRPTLDRRAPPPGYKHACVAVWLGPSRDRRASAGPRAEHCWHHDLYGRGGEGGPWSQSASLIPLRDRLSGTPHHARPWERGGGSASEAVPVAGCSRPDARVCLDGNWPKPSRPRCATTDPPRRRRIGRQGRNPADAHRRDLAGGTRSTRLWPPPHRSLLTRPGALHQPRTLCQGASTDPSEGP